MLSLIFIAAAAKHYSDGGILGFMKTYTNGKRMDGTFSKRHNFRKLLQPQVYRAAVWAAGHRPSEFVPTLLLGASIESPPNRVDAHAPPRCLRTNK